MSEIKSLPFDDSKDRFLELVRLNQVVILAAETGAGKSTKAPLALLRAGIGGDKMIIVTEPRRLATTLLAEWVAELYGTEVGDVVGYQIAHDRQISRATKLVYKTEGTLLAEIRSDPLLKRYGVIVLDEVHERGVNQDLLMALVSDVLPLRPDLKLVISSATIDTDKFSQFFGGAPVLKVPGRIFPVEVRYAHKTPEDMKEMVEMIIDEIDSILLSDEDGDVLVFMPDYDSIMKVSLGLEKLLGPRAKNVRIHQLYGNQMPDDRKAALMRDKTRRVFIATNIAETSITIDGLRHTVDSGLINTEVYVNASMSALQVTEHSRAGCNQRLGRVGRTQDGICHRMFTEENFLKRVEFARPQILRMSLDEVFLNLRCLHYSMDQVLALKFMDKPHALKWKDAESRLKILGAINSKGEVTADGIDMHRFKVAPMIGRMILEGKKRGCLEEILTIAACLSAEKYIFVRPGANRDEADESFRRYKRSESDALTMLKAWNEWDVRKGDKRWARSMFFSPLAFSQIDSIRDGFLDLLEAEEIEITSMKSELELKKAIASGLIVNLARLIGKYDYEWNGRSTFIFPGSAVMGSTPQYVVCATVVESTGENGPKAYMRGVHTVEAGWIPELVSLDACVIEIHIESGKYSGEQNVSYRRTWNGMEIERKTLEMIPQELIPYIAAALTKQLPEGYGIISESAPELQKIWNYAIPSDAIYVYGEARRVLIQPTMELFTSAIAKKIAGLPTIDAVIIAIGSMTAEDVLTDSVLKAYQAEQTAQLQRNHAEAERRAKMLKDTHEAETKSRAEVAPLNLKVSDLNRRLAALGSVTRDHYIIECAQNAVREPQYYGGLIGVQNRVDAYEQMVMRLEESEAPRFETTRELYTKIREVMPFCPVCGSAWDDSFACHVRHVPDRIIAKPGQDDWLIGSFKTDRSEVLASVKFGTRQSVSMQVVIRENAPWSGRVFKSVSYHPNMIILPESLLENREIILEYLTELDKAKRALENELKFIEDLKRGVTKGEIIRLTFHVRETDGIAIAEYKRDKIEAPADDLDRYPKNGESWWCHVISQNGPTKVALYRKEGTTRADVDQVITDMIDLFPDLPIQLVQ